MSKDLDDALCAIMKADYSSKAKAEGTVPLTAEKLREVVNSLKREEGRFIVIDANYIPDDVYGIIYLRPEDSARVKRTFDGSTKGDTT